MDSQRIIDRSERQRLVPYSHTHILRLENQGRFPKRLKLGPGRVGWLLSEIEAWIAERAGERDGCQSHAVALRDLLANDNCTPAGVTERGAS
jgi:prophage regulatory protein